jgi:hypothetical protein
LSVGGRVGARLDDDRRIPFQISTLAIFGFWNVLGVFRVSSIVNAKRDEPISSFFWYHHSSQLKHPKATQG